MIPGIALKACELEFTLLTIFTVPKPFVGHTGIIQRNAIRSWQQLGPSCQIILFGNEEGTAQAAKELGVEHVKEIQLSEHGAPLLDGMFQRAAELSTTPLLCFLNADIIFKGSIAALSALPAPFLVVGESMDLQVPSLIDFANPQWRESLGEGITRGPFALDYFIFTRGLYHAMPPFRVGRARYDNWMVWHALKSGAKVIDATDVLNPIHQNHDYGHLAGGRKEAYRGPDALYNQKLAGLGCYLYLYSTSDARWKLTREGLQGVPKSFRFLKQFFRRLTGWAGERSGLVQHERSKSTSDSQSKSDGIEKR